MRLRVPKKISADTRQQSLNEFNYNSDEEEKKLSSSGKIKHTR